MTTFSNNQKANCVLWLSETNDILTVQKKFQEEFCKSTTDTKLPSESEIRLWYENFEKTGSYDTVTKSAPDVNNEIKLYYSVAPQNVHKVSSGVDLHATDYEKDTGLMNFFGFNTIHKCHPYKMHLKGKITKEDMVHRDNFAQKELERIHGVHHLHHRIWFGGEAAFYTNGRVACHNLIYLAEKFDNPESKVAPPNTASCVTVWTALNVDCLLGPYIVNGYADKNAYNLFLRKFSYELRQIQRLKMKLENPIFMHDESPLHEDQQAQELLDKEFPFYWVGPGSKNAKWPRLSPDLNPLCFFLWGHIKHKVYETPIENDDVIELGQRIHHAFTEIMPEMLEAAVKSYKERLEFVVDNRGDFVDVHADNEHKMTFVNGGVNMPYYLY